MKIDISVIIPLYNTEKYIGDALESVLAQNKRNVQIIVVDGSASTVKPLQKKYHSIELYQQKNSGPATARNFGIKKAKGDYLMFMDSDDLLPEKSIEKLYKSIKSNHRQVAIGMFEAFNRNRRWSHNSMKYFISFGFLFEY